MHYEQRIDETDFIAFDTETTGLDPNACRIIEIAAIRFRGAEVLGEYAELAAFEGTLPPEIVGLHGISDSVLEGAAPLSEVLGRFVEFCTARPAILVAHNSGFDVGFLLAEWKRQGAAAPHLPVLDTWPLGRARVACERYRLRDLMAHFKLDQPSGHRALVDSHSVRLLFGALVAHPPPLVTLGHMHALARVRWLDSDAILDLHSAAPPGASGAAPAGKSDSSAQQP